MIKNQSNIQISYSLSGVMFVTIFGAMYGAIFLGQNQYLKKRNKEHEKENEEQEEQGKQTRTAREKEHGGMTDEYENKRK